MVVKKKAKKASKKKAVKSKEVVTKKAAAVIKASENFLPEELVGVVDTSLMGAQIDKDDIVISKAWLLQGTSTCVSDDNHEAIAGEYRNSRTLELIAGKGESFAGIVIDNYKSWQCFEEVKDAKGNLTMEYKETLNYYDHPNLKFDSVNPDTGMNIHRDLVLGYYILDMNEVMKGNAFPLILDFKRTSRNSGKDLATSIAQLASKNIPSYCKVYSFGTEQKQKETGKGKVVNYYVKTVSEGRWINKEELGVITLWAKELQKKKAEGRVHVDDTDVTGDKNDNVVEAEVVGNSRY